MTAPGRPVVAVVVLAWQAEPTLPQCLASVLASEDVDVRVVLWDNGCTRADLPALADDPRVRLVRSAANLGFAGGCNAAADVLLEDHPDDAPAPTHLLLLNSDCELDPDALAQLLAEADRPGTGPVMASVRLAADPALLNSGGNPVHVLGVSWAGGLDEPETRTAPFDVTGASGAALLLRADLWRRLGGFDAAYFAYLEDTELSLRCLRLGRQPRCVPTAVARHHYEFSRNPAKMYLLERNRLVLLATLWPRRALLALAPLLLGLELGVLAQAVAQGWGRGKVRSWLWLWRTRDHVRARRAQLAAEQQVPDAEWTRALTPRLDPRVIGSAGATRAVDVAVGLAWRGTARLLGAR
ncbi:glycosyltransferase family 2 protein [Rhodococcus aerolatus]